MRLRHCRFLFAVIICSIFSLALGSYESYGSVHDDDDYAPSYAAPPIVQPHHGPGHGHSAGSYYHYHVPLVGQQQQHYPPHYHQNNEHQYLWPLLLLLALPLLFLPLLPLLLLPLGISLLALLAPGGMMMMMMMMMMGGEMMMRRDTVTGRAFGDMRTFGEVVFMDVTSLMAKYARSLDLDQCPQRVACEVGAAFNPSNNATDTSTAKAFTSYLMDQYIPKGKVKKTIRQFEKAFWNGYGSGSCSVFHCQPAFKIYQQAPHEDPMKVAGLPIGTESPWKAHVNESRSVQSSAVNYVYPSTKANINPDYSNNSLQPTATESSTVPKLKIKRSHIGRYGGLSRPKAQDNEIPYTNDKYFRMFGTPTIKS